jgi:peptide/nickel transport system permease protein
MKRYVAGRVGQGAIVVLGAVVVSFVLTSLTGNAVDALGTGFGAETRRRLIVEYGFDRPLPARFLDYMGHALRGDFGRSFRSQEPAISLVLHALPYTLLLVGATMVVACAVALPTAVHSVLHLGSRADVGLRRLLMLLQGLPEFYVGLMLVLVFAVTLGWLPSLGGSGPASYVLPVVALSLPLMSTLTRLVRSQLLDVLDGEFVAALRAKGLTQREIVVRHGLPNALSPLIAYLALQTGWLLGGTVIVEYVFGIPGIGQLVIASSAQRDLNVLQAIVVVVATGYVLLNLLADLAVHAIDPRLRGAHA